MRKRLKVAEFHFKARTKEGKLVQGCLKATSHTQAEKAIKDQQLFLLELKESSYKGKFFYPFLTEKVGAEVLANFSYQIAAMLRAGLPLLTVLEIGADKTPKSFQAALHKVMEDLKKGESLAVSMEKQGRVFPPLMCSLIEAGEMGGILEEVFDWLSVHYERETQLQQKIISALTYPFLLFILTLGAIIFLLSFVVPRFAIMLQDVGLMLPIITARIVGLSQFLIQWGFWLVLFFLFLFYFFYRFLKTPEGAIKWDRFYLKIPLIGDLSVKLMSSRFCHVLGILLDKGVPILPALDVVKKTVNNSFVAFGLSDAQVSLQEGKQLTEPLKKMEIFPDLLLKMVEVGEETGQISQFLLKISLFYDREVEKTLERITKLIEPTLILIMGGLIGIIVLSLLLPLFNLLGTF